MFHGRDTEIHDLLQLKKTPIAKLVAFKGRRRVGKSTLAFEYAKHFKNFYHFAGIAPEHGVTSNDQRKEFAYQLENYLQVENLATDNWTSLFRNLAHLAKGETLILLDEVSWMAHDDPTFLPKFKTVWDTQFKQNQELVIIVCSSISSWIDKNLLSSTGFVGRISLEKTVKPLKLTDSLKFWGNQQVSPYKTFEFLSTVGCIPRYLEELDPRATSEQNIRRLFFQPGAFLHTEFDKIFSDLFTTKQANYKNIIETVSTQNKTQAAISQELPKLSASEISKLSSDLVTAGFLQRDYTWQIGKATPSRLSKYRISDNYIRFYMRYIWKNHKKIADNLMSEINLHNLPGWNSSLGYALENLVLDNREMIREALEISPHHIINDGPFYQPANQKQAGCQVDYMIELDGTLYLCEIKYSKNTIGSAALQQTQQQLKNIKIPKRYSLKPVLIHFGDITDQVEDSATYTKIIDFRDFLVV